MTTITVEPIVQEVTVTVETAAIIANNSVSNARLSDVPTNTIKGRNTAGNGDPQDLTVTQVRTMLETETTAQLNGRDTANRSRSNHTGTQTAATISDLPEVIETKIVEEVATTNANQFEVSGGIASVKTLFDYTAGTNVTFDRARWYGLHPDPLHAEYNKPREHFLNFSLTGAIPNICIVNHTALVTPEILVPFGPESYRSNYASEAAMLADQANQIANEYYTFDGVTFYLYNGVANGLITDYTSEAAVSGGKIWGTKPSWLIVQGDAYLEGADHLNVLTCEFKRRHEVGGTTVFNVVVVTIEAFTNGNIDADRENLHTIILNNFNENISPVTAESVTNESIYGEMLDPVLSNASAASYLSLGGGNFALESGVNSRFWTARTSINLILTRQNQRLLFPLEFTILCRIGFTFQDSTQNRPIFNFDNALTTFNRAGFNFMYIESSGQLQVQLANNSGTVASISSDALSPINAIGTGYWVFAIRYRWTGSTNNVFFYIKSSTNAVGWQQYGSERNSGATLPTFYNIMRVAYYQRSSPTISTGRIERRDYLQVWNKRMDVSVIQNIANQIDP